MDEDSDVSSKRECGICLYDLHLSAVSCPCSANRYSCLNHVKLLCSCAWSEKIFLFRYEISELNVLVEALEGKLNAVYRWARNDLKLSLHSSVSKDGLHLSPQAEKSKQKHQKSLDAATFNGTGKKAFSSIREEMKARILQKNCSSFGPKEEEKTSEPSVVSSRTVENSSLLKRQELLEISSEEDSSSVSLSESE